MSRRSTQTDATPERSRSARQRIAERLGGPDATGAGGPIDRSPSRVGAGLAIGFALLATLSLTSMGLLLVGLLGVVLVATGAVRGRRRTIDHGAFFLLLGALLAVFGDPPTAPLVLGTLFSLLAWDVGRYGITVGEQLGRGSRTVGIELAHAAVSASVGAAGAGIGYAAFLVASGSQSALALLLYLFGGFVLVGSLRS